MTKPNIRIFVDQHVYDHYGYDPMYGLDPLLEDALNYAGINCDVTPDTRIPIDGRNYDTTGDILDAFGKWCNNNTDRSSWTNQHLIFDEADGTNGGIAGGDGDGELGGGVSVGHGNLLRKLDSSNPRRYSEMNYGDTDHYLGDEVMVTMQEIGHNLGLCQNSNHDCGMCYVDWMVSWYIPDANAAYSTPLQAGRDGSDNKCGTNSIDPDDYNTEYCDAYYWDDCAGAQLRSIW